MYFGPGRQLPCPFVDAAELSSSDPRWAPLPPCCLHALTRRVTSEVIVSSECLHESIISALSADALHAMQGKVMPHTFMDQLKSPYCSKSRMQVQTCDSHREQLSLQVICKRNGQHVARWNNVMQHHVPGTCLPCLFCNKKA